MKDNTSLQEIDISKNMIGFTYVDEKEMLDIKMKNQDKLMHQTFEKLFYDSLGLEHFTIAFQHGSRLKSLNLSENDIGNSNFLILMPIFEANVGIENLNVADC